MIDFKYFNIKEEFIERIRLLLREKAVNKALFDKEFEALDKMTIQKICLEGFHRIFSIIKDKKGRVVLQDCKLQQFYYDYTGLETAARLVECDIDETKLMSKEQEEVIAKRAMRNRHTQYLRRKKAYKRKVRDNEEKKLDNQNRGNHPI